MAKENSDQDKILQEFVEKEETPYMVPNTDGQVGPPITTIPGTKLPWEKDLPLGNQIGWIPLPVADLPTRGLFYPLDTTIAIRSATGAEIRHWSTLEETDLSALDDMLNYIVERCVTIKSTDGEGIRLSWKDVKEVDRFYLLLAINELTFPHGENKLQIKVSDTKRVDVKKDMVSYISLDPQLMKYYDEAERCFILKPKGGKVLKLDIPSIGVTQWLKNYIFRKQRLQEVFDEDYLSFAPFIIRNWRGLSDDVYNKFVEDSNKWDVTTISLLVHVKKLFADTINPVIKYVDEGGTEQTAPLNFQGGIKSLFLISDPFGQLE
jgi:hypothetical protein